VRTELEDPRHTHCLSRIRPLPRGVRVDLLPHQSMSPSFRHESEPLRRLQPVDEVLQPGGRLEPELCAEQIAI
jgi:hypothetical protein